jgi:single-stranded DNA-binding protein
MESETQWHQVIVLGKQAELLYPVLGEGKRVYIEGPLTNREIVVQNKPVIVSRVRADRVMVLGHDRDLEKESEREEETVQA